MTAYKEAVNMAREIPASSCPSEVNNLLYASGGTAEAAEEKLAFQAMVSALDDRLPRRKKLAETQKPVSRRRKMEMIREENGGAEIERYRVDRDGCFWSGKDHLMVVGYDKYNAKMVTRRNGETDILFDMDTILRCGDRWYDQNGDSIPDECIHHIGGITDYFFIPDDEVG